MKCSACNYSYSDMKDDKQKNDGDLKFIKLINNFHFKDQDGTLEEAYLFVCPKCGTVKMERW
jgi:rubredoxin